MESCLFTIIKYIFLGIFYGILYFLYYTLPIFILVGGFIGGGVVGSNTYRNKYNDWDAEQVQEVTHKVIIHWENGCPDTIIYVREDMPYTIYGSDMDAAYYNYNGRYNEADTDIWVNKSDVIYMPSEAKKEGYYLIGFYTGTHGGSLVINAAGYGIVTLNEDLEIYANWGSINE